MTNTSNVLTPSNDVLPFSNFVENSGNLSTLNHNAKWNLSKQEKHSHATISIKSFDILNHKVHDKKKAKKILRNAEIFCANDIRSSLWIKLGNILGADMHKTDAYEEVLKDVYGDEVETFQMGDTVQKSFKHHFIDPNLKFNHHHLNAEGIFCVNRILTVIAYERPDITYAPTLPSITSILLHYLSEEQVYYLVGSLLSRAAKERFITQTRIAYQASAAVFKKLAHKYFKGACTHLKKKGNNLDEIFFHWVFWIFNHLPFSHLVRVIDCYLYEGPKILYRVGLAILHHYDKHKRLEGKIETYCGKIETYCGKIEVCPRTLLKTSFHIRGLSRGKMFELMNKRELDLSTRDSTYTYVAQTTSSSSLHVPSNIKSDLVSRSDGDGLKGDFDVSHMYNNVKSALMTRAEWRHVYEWIPNRMTLKKPSLVFSTAEHGTSLLTFYNQVEGHDPTFLVIKSTCGQAIGAYLAGDWAERRTGSKFKYFGTGESFVCQLQPNVCKFAWVGIHEEQTANKHQTKSVSQTTEGQQASTSPPMNLSSGNSMFATGDATGISIGGGKGQAIQLDSNLLQGLTTHCSTFNNPPLIASSQFKVATLEVFAFE